MRARAPAHAGVVGEEALRGGGELAAARDVVRPGLRLLRGHELDVLLERLLELGDLALLEEKQLLLGRVGLGRVEHEAEVLRDKALGVVEAERRVLRDPARDHVGERVGRAQEGDEGRDHDDGHDRPCRRSRGRRW